MASAQVRFQVAVAAEHSLIGEAVGTALRGRGVGVTPISWPGAHLPAPRSGEAVDVGLLVCELDRWPGVLAAGQLLHALPIRWAVLAGAAQGPLWGAAYEDGADVILPSTTALDEVVAALAALVEGTPIEGAEERGRLRAQWRALREERARMNARASSLTAREREVLVLLYEGATTLEIAALLEVSPSTVRSQMKAIRRKLGVNTQLGAVAAYGALIRTEPQAPVRS